MTDAIKWIGKNVDEIVARFGSKVTRTGGGCISVHTRDGWRHVYTGDWVAADGDHVKIVPND